MNHEESSVGHDVSAVFDVMATARAIRHLRADPVPRDVVERLVWAATRAPSPGNTQDWTFLAVDDRAAIADVAATIADARAEPTARYAEQARGAERRMLSATLHLVTHLALVPVMILVCGGVSFPPGAPREQYTWAALYPATQNLLLAARALGLGAALTTLHGAAEATVRERLSIPDAVRIAATVPVGYPAVAFGAVRRRPVDEVLRWNSW